MGLHSKRTYAIQSNLKHILDDIFSVAISCHHTHGWILEKRTERIFNSPDWKKLPHHAQAWLSGYCEARFDEIHRNHLEWRHYIPWQVNGRSFRLLTIPETRELAETEKDIYHKIDSDRSTFFWKGHPDKPYRPVNTKIQGYDDCDNCETPNSGIAICSLDGLGFCCEECLNAYLLNSGQAYYVYENGNYSVRENA